MCYWSCFSPFPSFANIYAHSWRWLIYFSTCVISWYLSVLPLSLWDNQHSLWCYGIVIVNSCMVLHPCDCVASTGASVLSLLESSCTLCFVDMELVWSCLFLVDFSRELLDVLIRDRSTRNIVAVLELLILLDCGCSVNFGCWMLFQLMLTEFMNNLIGMICWRR